MSNNDINLCVSTTGNSTEASGNLVFAEASAPPRPSDASSCYTDYLLNNLECITTNPDDSIEVHLLDCNEILAPALCCKSPRPPSSLNRSIDASVVTEETAANTSGEGESILSSLSLTGSPQTLGSDEDIPEKEKDGMNDVPIGEADNLSGWMPMVISNIWGSVVSYPSNMQCWDEDSSSTHDTLLRSTGSSSRSRCSNPKISARNPNSDRTKTSATQKLNSALELRRTETNKEQVQKQEYELHKIKKESSFAVDALESMSKLSILHRQYDSPTQQEASCGDTTEAQGDKKPYMHEPLVGRELFRMLGNNSKHSFGDRASRAKQISGMLINDDDSVQTGKLSMADTVEENTVAVKAAVAL